MSQAEVIEILEKHGELTSKEITCLTKKGMNSIQANLRKLLKIGTIEFREIPRIIGKGAPIRKYKLKK